MAREIMKHKRIWMKNHSNFNERWLHEQIKEDPSLLGLGDLDVRDSERTQPTGGRLDLLLVDPNSLTRYEVELQLGAMDESHLIRTIEYWDVERRRYPQYEHVAVIAAEDVTTRFLNVIHLLHRSVPLIAVQLQLIEFNEALLLVPTVIVEPLPLGTEEEDEGETTDRAHWERKVSPEAMSTVDQLIEKIRRVEPKVMPKYNKHYVGLTIDGAVRNFASFRPRQQWCVVHFSLHQSDEMSDWIESTDLVTLPYERRWNEYRVKVRKADLSKQDEELMHLITAAYDAYGKRG